MNNTSTTTQNVHRKIRLLVVSDGYSEYRPFKEKFDSFLEQFEGEKWFKNKLEIDEDSYPNIAVNSDNVDTRAGDLFDVKEIFIASREEGAGVSKECEGIAALSVKNALGSRFCHGRAMGMGEEVPFRVLRGDIDKVKKALYSRSVWDYVLVLVNTQELEKKYKNGGSIKIDRKFIRGGYADIGNKICWASANCNDWFALAMHELGHVIFNLHEEYDYNSVEGRSLEFYGNSKLSESNIIPVGRVEYLLEVLRRTAIDRKNLDYLITNDGKDYLIRMKSDKTNESVNETLLTQKKKSDKDLFKDDISTILKADDKSMVLKHLGFTNRELQWFREVNGAAGAGLFTYTDQKEGPFSGTHCRVGFNVFWRRFDGDVDDDSQEFYLYHRRKKLEEYAKKGSVGFYEGAGTFRFGLARPVWSCRMRETRSDGRIREETAYFEQVEKFLDASNGGRGISPRPDANDLTGEHHDKNFCPICEKTINRALVELLFTSNVYEAPLFEPVVLS